MSLQRAHIRQVNRENFFLDIQMKPVKYNLAKT